MCLISLSLSLSLSLSPPFFSLRLLNHIHLIVCEMTSIRQHKRKRVTYNFLNTFGFSGTSGGVHQWKMQGGKKTKASFHWAKRDAKCDQNISVLLSRLLLYSAFIRRQCTEHFAVNFQTFRYVTQ